MVLVEQDPEGVAEIVRSARQEGCVASPLLTSAIHVVVATVLIVRKLGKRTNA